MLAQDFIDKGYKVVKFGEHADVCVVNTCTVTGKTDYQCRQALRKAAKTVPGALIVAVGCYSQLFSEDLANIQGVDLVLGSNNKFDLLQRIEEIADQKSTAVFVNHNQEKFVAPNSGQFVERTRAFLKIQDGCNSFCTYCAVPLARGPSRSASIKDVVNRAQLLVDQGYKEIVLTGVHIGRFGEGNENSTNLSNLLRNLEKVKGLQRIRLSSLDPQEVTDELIEVAASSSKICHHFHIPLQSGDNEILRSMKRGYTTSEFSALIEKLDKTIPNAGFGTDIIVGFPGETPAQFRNTFDIVRNLPFSNLHVFKYSRRPNTEAAKLYDNVTNPEKKDRSQKLREVGQIKKNEFYKRQIGHKLRVLFENRHNGFMTGWADNYIRVAVPFKKVHANELYTVRINRAKENLAIGSIIAK